MLKYIQSRYPLNNTILIMSKGLVSAPHLNGAQSVRLLRLSESASGAQIIIGDRWARAHLK